MARPYAFPDPNDRSPNEPSIIVSSEQVLGIYNQNNEEKMQKVTAKVQDWFIHMAEAYQWDTIKFSGNQCFLEVTLKKRTLPE